MPDVEITAISRMLSILKPLRPVERARVVEYVVSRAESMGMPEPVPEKEGELMFPDQETRRADRTALAS